MYFYERAVYWKTSDPPNILNYPYTNFLYSGPFVVFLFQYFFLLFLFSSFLFLLFYRIFSTTFFIFYFLPVRIREHGFFPDNTVPDFGFVMVTLGLAEGSSFTGRDRTNMNNKWKMFHIFIHMCNTSKNMQIICYAYIDNMC